VNALELLLDRKYKEVELAILRERDDISHLNYLEQMDRLQALAKLEALGVLPAIDDCPFKSPEAHGRSYALPQKNTGATQRRRGAGSRFRPAGRPNCDRARRHD
jgi:hypothetical protein